MRRKTSHESSLSCRRLIFNNRFTDDEIDLIYTNELFFTTDIFKKRTKTTVVHRFWQGQVFVSRCYLELSYLEQG